MQYKENIMIHNRIKVVKDKNGRNMYYLGDGIWFGRIAESAALKGLASKKYIMWENKLRK